ICNEHGGIRDDVLVYRFADGFSMVVNASNREKILAWIDRHQESAPVRVHDTTRASCMVAVQGPGARECCRGLVPANLAALPYYYAVRTTYQGRKCVVSRTGYTGEVGFEFIVDT